jgi:hypothetical protein
MTGANEMPKTVDHPDSALFALADECASARRDFEKAMDALDVAEMRHRPVPIPPTLLRTKRDAELQVSFRFANGAAYGFDEIAALRKMIRVLYRSGSDGSAETYARGTAILRAWADYTDAKAANEAESGYAAAMGARNPAGDRFEKVGAELAKTRATTLAGILAKVQAMLEVIGDDEGMTLGLCAHLREYGAEDGEAITVSVTRDLAAMVRSAAAQ